MSATRITILALMFAMGFLINHVWDAFSAGAAEMVILGAILGGAITGLGAMDLLAIPQPKAP